MSTGVARTATEVSVASAAADWPSATSRPNGFIAAIAATAGAPHSGSSTTS